MVLENDDSVIDIELNINLLLMKLWKQIRINGTIKKLYGE